jgi:Sucrose synthase
MFPVMHSASSSTSTHRITDEGKGIVLSHTAKDELKRLAEEMGGEAGDRLLSTELAKLIQTTQEIVCIPPRVAFSFRPDIGQAWWDSAVQHHWRVPASAMTPPAPSSTGMPRTNPSALQVPARVGGDPCCRGTDSVWVPRV